MYIVYFFLLQSVGYAVILYGLWSGVVTSHRTCSFRILITAASCMFAGSTVRALAIYFFSNSALPSFNRSNAEFGGALELFGLLIVAYSWVLKPLFFRSLRKPLANKDYVISVLTWCTITIPQMLLFARFGYGAAVGIYTAVAMIALSCWSLLELHGIQDLDDLTLKVLRQAFILMIAVHCYFIYYNINFLLESTALVDSAQQYIETDSAIRMSRISIVFAIDALCLFYWSFHYSTRAILAQEDRKKIDLVLKEKDQLIKNLINASALIQTGALTAGLSHEINQFLAVIQLNVDSADLHLANRNIENIGNSLSRVREANTGAASLIQNVKKLFVRQDEELTKVDVDKLIESVATLYLARAALSKIVLTFDLRSNAQALIRETLIRQVVSNLVVNAIDALDLVSRPDKTISIQTCIEQDHWILRVSDNAQGIRPENAHKIFSLFSTSKSEGTGIGLWLSRYIVEQHGGYLRFTNLEPNGVMFWIDMPLVSRLDTDRPSPSKLFYS